jgi:methylated-DNA-[protein]-cysteine S-methyltransferase
MSLYKLEHESPIGRLSLYATDDALVGLYLPEHRHAPRLEARDGAGHPVLERAREQLTEYFAGRRRSFDLPLAPRGTEHQETVWRALREIPFGGTRSYGELAAHLGRPRAARAVGAANGKNPISIVIPCHRVVGADGSLTGYAGGTARKEWLLRHEQAP